MELGFNEDMVSKTTFAYMLPLSATEEQVKDYFSEAGKVEKVTIMSSRGYWYGYIEFLESGSVETAVARSNDTPFLDQMVKVLPVNTEKNLVPSNASPRSDGSVARIFYISHLNQEVTKGQLEELFGRFGLLDSVRIEADTSQSKVTAIVQFADFMRVNEIVKGRLLLNNMEIKVSDVENGMDSAVNQYTNRTLGISFPELANEYKRKDGYILKDLEDIRYFKSLNPRQRKWKKTPVQWPTPEDTCIVTIDASCCWPNQFGYGAIIRDSTGKDCFVIYGNVVNDTKCTQYQEAYTILRLLSKIDESLFPNIMIISDNRTVISMLKGEADIRNNSLLKGLKQKIQLEMQKKYYKSFTKITFKWNERESNYVADRLSRMGLELAPGDEYVSTLPSRDWTTRDFLHRDEVGGFVMDTSSKKHRPRGTAQAATTPSVDMTNASEFLVLKNLLSPTSDFSEFDKMKAYILTKCSNFDQAVSSSYFDKDGNLFLKFRKVKDAAKFKKYMHYRWENSRLVRAIYCLPDRALWDVNPRVLNLLNIEKCKADDPRIFEERLSDHASTHIESYWHDTIRRSMRSKVRSSKEAPSRQRLIEEAIAEFGEKITEDYKGHIWPTPAESSQERETDGASQERNTDGA